MHKHNNQSAGFTIVELLIVIVVIAILAAISIAAFTGIQNRSYDSAVESDIQAIIKKMELARVDLGYYPRIREEFPGGFKFSKGAYDTASNNIYFIADIVNDEYAFGLRSKSGRGYIINTGSVSSGVGVSAGTTAAALDHEIIWGNVAGVSAIIQGYSASGTWTGTWEWTSN